MVKVQDKLDSIKLLTGYVDKSLRIIEHQYDFVIYEYIICTGTAGSSKKVIYGFTHDDEKDIEDQEVTSESCFCETATAVSFPPEMVVMNSLRTYPLERIEVRWTTETDFNKGTFSDTQVISESGGAVTLKGGSTTAYACWHLNEASGTNAPDATGNNRNGTTVNLPLWVPGRFYNCLQFDGVNMYVNCGDIANWERTSKFSVECWFKTNSTATMALIARRSHIGLAYAGWELNMNNGKVQMILSANVTNGYYIAKTTDLQFNDSNWHHVIATYNGNCALSGLKVYIDGALASTTTSGTVLSYSILFAGNCLIGMRNAATAPYSGLIDEAILYDKELSEAQVLQRYTGGEWGADYPTSGMYTSNSYDSSYPNNDWDKIYFNQSLPVGTTSTYKVRTSVDGITWSDWSAALANGEAITLNGRYIQWKADLTTTDVATTPKLYDLSLTYYANPSNMVTP